MAKQAWSRKGEWDREVLEHIRAMLLVLAALVERAAGLPVAERLHFLAVMGRGEAEVRRLLMAMTAELGAPTGCDRASPSDPWSPMPIPAADGRPITPVHSAGDVGLLAARFRMLALAVDAMLALAGAKPSSRAAFPFVGFPDRNPRRAVAQFTPSPALRATSPPARGRGAAALATMFLSANG